MAVGQPGDDERARDRGEVHAGDQQPGRAVAPAALPVGIGKPRDEAVVGRPHRREDRDEQPRRARAPRQAREEPAGAADVHLAAALQHRPRDGDRAGDGGQGDQCTAPAAEDAGERDRDRRGDGRADLDAGRVDARSRRGPLGHRLPDGERRERVPEPHADAHAPREQHDERSTRREGAEHAERPDQREPDRHRATRAEPGREVGRDRGEEPHAEHRDGAEEPYEGVRRVEIVLDLVDQRPDTHDLGPQSKGGEKQPCECGGPRAVRQRPAAFARRRAMRPNSSTCLRASRPAAPGFPARIASRIGTCFSAASCGSTYVP